MIDKVIETSHLEGLYIQAAQYLLSLIKWSVSLSLKGYILEWGRKIRRRLSDTDHTNCHKIALIVSPPQTQTLRTALYSSCHKTYQANK